MATNTQKGTAVVLFPHFCGYELSVLLDMPIIQSMRQRGEEPDYLLDGNILTAGGWKFREWALAFCRTLGLPVSPSAFGSDLQ